jgi:hypothetical protein
MMRVGRALLGDGLVGRQRALRWGAAAHAASKPPLSTTEVDTLTKQGLLLSILCAHEITHCQTASCVARRGLCSTCKNDVTTARWRQDTTKSRQDTSTLPHRAQKKANAGKHTYIQRLGHATVWGVRSTVGVTG